jgi:hypothetical protein
MKRISEQNDIFMINVRDKILELMKKGVKYFQVHEHNYVIDFLLFFPEQIDVKFMKQLIFDHIHQRYEKNIGIEFEVDEEILFDSTIAATIENNSIWNLKEGKPISNVKII